MIKLILLWLGSIFVLPIIAWISPFDQSLIKLVIFYGDIVGALVLYVLINIRLVELIRKKMGKITGLLVSAIAVLLTFIFAVAAAFICLSFMIIKN